MSRHVETIAALATPVGTAALAVLRVTGPDTLRIATDIMGRPPLPRRARHCDYRDKSGALIDDVLMIFFRGPGSYTGEDSLEISSHGNPLIAQKILEDLFARGCRPAEPGEFTRRAFLNGRMDLSQAEAVMDVIHARSERALAAANQQLRGSLARRMNHLVDGLLNVLARIEAHLDFPEEDLPVEDRVYISSELNRLSKETKQLLATGKYGSLLRDGMKVVIVGEPNVGKSSLLNRLVGRERALVSPEPGTTRDFIEERIMVGSHCCRLIDTAGLNPSPVPVEDLGMAMTRERLKEADLALVVLDASRDAEIPEELHLIAQQRNCLIVLNKSDLSSSDLSKNASPIYARPMVSVSALLGHGMADLLAAVAKYAQGFQEQTGDEVLAVNSRHTESLKDAHAALLRSRENCEAGVSSELVAADLRLVLNAYGEILGRVDNEYMLDRLFSTFCIGK